MSSAMAMLCGGDVRSIHRDPYEISKDGIFWTVERLLLIGNRNGLPIVNSVRVVSWPRSDLLYC